MTEPRPGGGTEAGGRTSLVARQWRRGTAAIAGLRVSTRLAFTLGLLALLVFGLVGVLTVTTMRGFLTRQLDEQLSQETGQLLGAARVDAPLPPVPRHWLRAILVPDAHGTLQVVSTGSPPGQTPLPEALPGLDVHGLPAFLDRARVATVAQHGRFDAADVEYQALATPIGAGRVLLLAAPRDGLEYTSARLGAVEAVAFTVALAVVVLAGSALLRRGLRPLSTMATTAHRIASTDLSGDSPAVGLRAGGTGGGLEITELRSAFNHMLAHIDSSLASRAAAEQRLRTFVADASHELRTPLTSIRGYADLFQYAAANEPAERAAHLGRLRAETARMGDLLDDLLLLARLDAQSPFRPEPIDLRGIVESGVASFRAAYPEHPLSTALAESAPVRGDAGALRRALDNLLTNAAVHTPDGTPVAVDLDATADRVRLRVADEGPGIPAASIDKVFDRFYRVDNSRTRNRPASGTGLGLAITNGIVRAHHGTLDVDSVPGATTFTITIPAAHTEPHQE